MKKANLLTHTLFCFIFMLSAFDCSSQVPQRNTEMEHETLKKLETGLVNGQHELSHYNTARYFALAGKPALAFGYLLKAVHEGFSRLKDIKKDPDLLSLHSDPRWPGILKSVAENLTQHQKTTDLFFNKKSFWEPGTLETPYKQNITENEKIAGLSKFWSEVKYNFVNFDLIPDVNLDSLYLAWLPKVRQSTSTREYYLLLQELAANLRDSHTLVLGPSELVDSVYARPLVRTRLIENKVLIVGVYDPVLSQKGISIGQEVVKVNGVPVKDYAARHVIPYVSASTLQDKMVRAYDYALLGGSVNQP